MKKFDLEKTKIFLSKYGPWFLGLVATALIVITLGLVAAQKDTRGEQNGEQVLANSNKSALNNTEQATSTTSSSSSTNETAEVKQQDSATTTTKKVVTFDSVSLTAETAIVWDVSNAQPLFVKKPDKERPLASLTKLMTALVATQNISENPDAEVEINQDHLKALGNNNLTIGQVWNLDDLVSFMLVESSNDAARAVAAAYSEDPGDGYAKQFVENMNSEATSLGLQNTYFFNPSGLDLNETIISGGYGTARDIARLFSHILTTYPDLLKPTTKSSVTLSTKNGTSYVARNTNTALDLFPNILGSKTGYTTLAGGNLAIGLDVNNEQQIVIVVLGSTKEGRFSDVYKLSQASQNYFTDNNREN